MSNFTPYCTDPSGRPFDFEAQGLNAYQGQQFQTWLVQASVVIAFFWVVLEIAFMIVLYYVLLPNLHRLKTPTPYRGDIIRLMKKTIHHVKDLQHSNFVTYIRGFCNMAKFEDIRIDNYRSLLAWIMYHKHLQDLNVAERADLETIVEYTTEQHPEARQLKPGFNPDVTHCRMTLEPLPVIHRPLLMYVLANLTEILANAVLLRASGFQHLEVDGMTYWYKQHGQHDTLPQDTHSSHGDEPLVFLHGISTGWMVYMSLIKALGRNRTMVLIDTDAIKIKSLNFDMPSPEQFVDRVERILDRHNIAKASFVGHSFGSITAGWFVQAHPHRVSHLTLIDPVSLLLGLPNVAYSFLYREPSTMMEWIIHISAARELTISYSLRRHFFWYHNNLCLQDVPAHIGVVVAVSSNDEIINAPAVHEYTNNCRAARLAAAESEPPSCVLGEYASMSESSGGASPRRVTRSMSSQVMSHNTRHVTQSISTHCAVNTVITPVPVVHTTKSRTALIESVMWEGFSHGQILISSQAKTAFVELVRSNEKLGTAC